MIPGTDTIIDLSHWNTVEDLEEVKSAGIAIIHKCSQGLVNDPSYEEVYRDVQQLGGILWGAYHFGVKGQDPIQQAHTLLMMSELGWIDVPRPKVLALDWEWNKVDTMTADQAAAFVTEIQKQTGRWPLLYTSAAFVSEQGAIPLALRNCELWLTGFTTEPNLSPLWGNWRIWQHGIGTCAGIDGQVDRDTFNGTPAELVAYFS